MLKLLLPPLLMLLAGFAHAQAKYIVTDLGRIGAAGEREGAMAVNDRGQVAGGASGDAFLWTNGKRRDLGTLPMAGPESYAFSVAYGLNNRGIIAGSTGSFGPVTMTGLEWVRGIVTHSGVLQQLGDRTESFIPFAINDAGQIAGRDGYQGFFYANGEFVSIGIFSSLANGTRSAARGLNQSGQVVGWATIRIKDRTKRGHLAAHAFLWQRQGNSARMRDLGTLRGRQNSYAYSINKRAEVAGSASDGGDDLEGLNGLTLETHTAAFLWRSGKMVGLGTLPDSKNSEAFGINDRTEVVGRSNKRAFLWASGRMLDLNTYLPARSGWTLEEARAINNRGQIVGTGKLNGQIHMFLLTPTK